MRPLVRIRSFRIWPSQVVLVLLLALPAALVRWLAGVPVAIAVGVYLVALAGAVAVEDKERERSALHASRQQRSSRRRHDRGGMARRAA